MKKTQIFTAGLLPLIVIGGWFIPVLGYLVLGMMMTLVGMAFFSHRLWCWRFCPRGALLDIALPPLSRRRPLPAWAVRPAFRGLIFLTFMAVFIARILSAWGRPQDAGFVFVAACGASTILAIILAVFTKPRGWCMICPMGSLQDAIVYLRKRKRPAVSIRKDLCIGCGNCAAICPKKILIMNPQTKKCEVIDEASCDRKAGCVQVCPVKAIEVRVSR